MKIENLPPLWEHQRKAIEARKDRFCLFFDTGTGKTRTILEIYRDITDRLGATEIRKAIIVAPLNVCRNWKDEIGKYLERAPAIHIVAGQTASQKEKAICKFNSENGPSFLCINTESFQQKKYVDLLVQGRIQMLVVDEAHDFKTDDSARTKELMRLNREMKPKYLYLLTGTPAPQGEIDLWTPLRLMGITDAPFPFWRKRHFVDVMDAEESREYLKRLYDHLNQKMPKLITMPPADWKKDLLKRAHYAESPLRDIWIYLYNAGLTKDIWIEWSMSMVKRLRAFPKWEIRKDSKEELASKLATVAMTVKKEDAIDLPPLLRTTVFCELEKEQRTAYDSMANNLRAELGDGQAITASNALAKMIRLQQIAAGYLPLNETTKHFEHSRLAALEYAIDLVGNAQFLIWTVFEPTYQAIGKALQARKIGHAFITGNQSAAERHDSIAKFQAGKLDALIAHPKAGGVGVNMTAASYSIHYTKDYNLVSDMQAEARNYRGGSDRHEKITRIDILAADTIDENIHEALLHKKSLQDLIMSFRGHNNASAIAKEINSFCDPASHT